MPASTWACCPAASLLISRPYDLPADLDRMAQAEKDHLGRFIGLSSRAGDEDRRGHRAEAAARRSRFPRRGPSRRRCRTRRSTMNRSSRSSRRAATSAFMCSSIRCEGHQLNRMDADDLRPDVSLGFSLMIATIRIINSGLLDEFPTVKSTFALSAPSALSRPLQRLPAAHQVGHVANRGPQPPAQALGRPLSQHRCSMTAPAGLVPIRAGRSAPTG